MKKQILFAAATMFALAFTSCKKYEVSEPLNLSELRKVTIQGSLFAELDETNAGLEKAPQGLKITVSVPFSDYNPNTTSGNHIVTTTTDANGNFSIQVPVVSNGVDATISFESFTTDVLEIMGAHYNLEGSTQFKLSNSTVSGLGTGNSLETIDLGTLQYVSSFTDPNANTFVPTTSVMFEGILEYESSLTASLIGGPDSTVYTPVPEGTVLIVDIYSEDEFGREFYQSKTVTVMAGGNYQIEVPLVKNGYADLEFYIDEILQYNDVVNTQNYLYQYQDGISETLYFVDYTNKDYQFNKGLLVQTLN